MAGSLDPLKTSAALAEQVYRRAKEDQQLTDGDIGVRVVDGVFGNLQGPVLTTQGDGWYYNNATGFVGRVVSDGTTTYVVLRGTDMSGSLGETALNIASNYFGGGSLTQRTDVNDFTYANLALGFGSAGTTQLDDACWRPISTGRC